MKSMKKLIPGLIFLMVFILAVVIYYNYSTRKTEEILKQLHKDYPAISITEKIDAIISNIEHGNPEIFRNHPHQAYLTLDGLAKKRIRTGYELVQELMLDDVLEPNDRLIKEAGTDRVQIYKVKSNDTLIYEFELRDDLGYPLKTY